MSPIITQTPGYEPSLDDDNWWSKLKRWLRNRLASLWTSIKVGLSAILRIMLWLPNKVARFAWWLDKLQPPKLLVPLRMWIRRRVRLVWWTVTDWYALRKPVWTKRWTHLKWDLKIWSIGERHRLRRNWFKVTLGAFGALIAFALLRVVQRNWRRIHLPSVTSFPRPHFHVSVVSFALWTVLVVSALAWLRVTYLAVRSKSEFDGPKSWYQRHVRLWTRARWLYRSMRRRPSGRLGAWVWTKVAMLLVIPLAIGAIVVFGTSAGLGRLTNWWASFFATTGASIAGWNWWLIGGIAGGIVLLALISYLVYRWNESRDKAAKVATSSKLSFKWVPTLLVWGALAYGGYWIITDHNEAVRVENKRKIEVAAATQKAAVAAQRQAAENARVLARNLHERGVKLPATDTVFLYTADTNSASAPIFVTPKGFCEYSEPAGTDSYIVNTNVGRLTVVPGHSTYIADDLSIEQFSFEAFEGETAQIKVVIYNPHGRRCSTPVDSLRLAEPKELKIYNKPPVMQMAGYTPNGL